MLFNSYGFMLAFLPVFIIGFYAIRHYFREDEKLMRLCNLWIIAGSLVFYAFFGVENLLILIISILFNALVIRFMNDSKILLAVGITGNVLFLLSFKFAGTFLPVAISFYTFNQISYLVDRFRGEIKDFDLPEYLSYILFFPKLLQGPLMGYDAFRKQLINAAKEHLDFEAVMRGILLISIGLFKKVIMADTIGKAVNYGYESLATLGWWEAVLVAVFYSFQLYFDFSGYCDVASGICMMTGFELSLNFDSPYKALNIIDFWNRWHITLTKFFTKYIYIPLGGSRKSAVRTYVNILIVFLVSGLWHGTGWTFIIWGAMHGILNAVTRALGNVDIFKAKKGLGGYLINITRRTFTFIYVTVAWVFFRAGTVSDAFGLFGRMISGGIRPYYSDLANYFRLDELWYVLKLTPIVNYSFSWDLCMWIFLFGSAIIVFFGKSAVNYARECKIGVFTTLLSALLLVWCILSFGGVSTYLYMNF